MVLKLKNWINFSKNIIILSAFLLIIFSFNITFANASGEVTNEKQCITVGGKCVEWSWGDGRRCIGDTDHVGYCTEGLMGDQCCIPDNAYTEEQCLAAGGVACRSSDGFGDGCFDNEISLGDCGRSMNCCKEIVTTKPSTPSNYTYIPLEPIFQGDKDGGFVHYIQMIYKFLIWTVGIAALLMLTIGGFMYMTSAGNKANAETAKKIIKDALLGLIIVLVAWIILYLINPDLIKINLESIEEIQVTLPNLPAGAGPGAPRAVPIDPKNPPTNLPKGCENYKQAFHDAADGDSELECLLYAVASAESRCDPNADSGLACGIMQFKPSTARKTCPWLKENPNESIVMAAKYLGQNQSYLNSHYKKEFSIGSSAAQSTETVTVGNYTYNAGNDDLIASYNAGAGRGPFTPSVDCAPSDPKAKEIPAWQCDKGVVFANGQTIDYVQRVQAFQKMCTPIK